MPIQPTYPGVYVQEIPSGVHTITGVATSITAFIGQAKSGPVNVATNILSFADFERNFGGLDSDFLMSYAVQQFFLNGGTQAKVVRVVSQNTGTDTKKIQGGNKDVLQISALSPGQSDRTTDVFIEHNIDPNSPSFRLIIVSTAKPKPTDAPNAPKDIIAESFPLSSSGSQWLSMDKTKPNYVVTLVNGVSQLITVTDLAQDGTLPDATSPDHGELTSGLISTDTITGLPHGVVPASDNTHTPKPPSTTFRITLDGTTPYTVKPTPPLGSKFTNFDDAATAITTAVQALKRGDPAFDNFICSVEKDDQGHETDKLMLISGSYGSNSSVTVQPLAGDTLATDLQLVNGTAVSATTSQKLTGGSPGTPPGPDEEFDMFIGSRANFEGIYALDKVDLVNLICLPDVSDPKILSFVDAYCQERRAFMIVDPPPNKTPNDMYNDITGTFYGPLLTDHGALYYPRPLLPDPLNNGNLRASPPCGIIAGLYARTDSNRGVWKSPAGTEATLTGVQAFEYMLNNGENGILNPQAVNCLRFFPGYGFVSWGARTLRGSDNVGDEYKYVAVRRTALFLEESLLRGLQWAVFEPNDEPLWAQIRLNVGAFMQDLFRKGAFQGKTPRDAFFVKCDSETTTQEDIDHGIVNVVVGFAPLKPAEFVIISLQQIAGQLQA